MKRPKESVEKTVFDYRTLRLLVGLVAFSLPVIVWLVSTTPIASISASYHTEARDVFVGGLFIIGALLFAYNGHTPTQRLVSKGAAVAAVITAIFPIACETCEFNKISVTHTIAAIFLFATIAYFCLGPFRKSTKGQKGKKGRRAVIYLVCGIIIIGAMLAIAGASIVMSAPARKALAITFVGELVALWAFGVAWIVAGKFIPALTDEEDRLTISF
jgi:hypothetical protein